MPTIVVPQAYLFLDSPEKKVLVHYLLAQRVLEHKTNQWDNRFKKISELTKKQSDITLF